MTSQMQMDIVQQPCYLLNVLLSQTVLTLKLCHLNFTLLSFIWTTSHLVEHLEKPLKNKTKRSFRFRPCKNINMNSFIIKLLRQ